MRHKSVIPLPTGSSASLCLLTLRFFAAREDFVPRASCPCSGMARMAMAQFWMRLCRAAISGPPRYSG
jgi:hypothetical protein